MKQTEKRERRLIVRFILIVLACGVLGYFVGMFMAEYGGNIRPLPQSAMESITRMFPFLFAGYNLELFAASTERQRACSPRGTGKRKPCWTP